MAARYAPRTITYDNSNHASPPLRCNYVRLTSALLRVDRMKKNTKQDTHTHTDERKQTNNKQTKQPCTIDLLKVPT